MRSAPPRPGCGPSPTTPATHRVVQKDLARGQDLGAFQQSWGYDGHDTLASVTLGDGVDAYQPTAVDPAGGQGLAAAGQTDGGGDGRTRPRPPPAGRGP